MAKIINPEYITSAVVQANPHLCFYRMDGELHMRLKSSLTSKRVKKDPAFRLTRVYAGLMAQASRMTSGVFQRIPLADRRKGMYKSMVGVAMKELKAGSSREAVVILLEDLFLSVVKPTAMKHMAVQRPAKRISLHKRKPLKKAVIFDADNTCTPLVDIKTLSVLPIHLVQWSQAG